MAPAGKENTWLKSMWELLEKEYKSHQSELHSTNIQLEKSLHTGKSPTRGVDCRGLSCARKRALHTV